MSLIYQSRVNNGGRAVWVSLWPFWLFVLALIGALAWVSLHWPQIMMQSVEWQRQLHQRLAQLIQQVQLSPRQYGGSLLLFSLTYGILHAVGPGHGKMVITTYLSTHPARLQLSIWLTLLASLLQGIMAISLVSVTLLMLKMSSTYLHVGELWLERAGYMLMVLLGALLCRRAGLRLWRSLPSRKSGNGRASLGGIYRNLRYIHADINHQAISRARQQQAGHFHHPGCGCRHHHVLSDQTLQTAVNWRTKLSVVLAMGIRPCSGAVLVLLFAKVMGVYLWGVLSALVMAAGTSLTLLLLSLLVFYARRYAENLTRRHTANGASAVAWATLALAGGLLLITAGIILYGGAQDVISTGVRPFSR